MRMISPLTPEEQKKQEYYRDARFLKYYDGIWQNTGKCVFCDLREKYILFEQDGMVLTITLYAYIDGDMMIVPRRHVSSTSELSAREWEAARKLMYLARKLIRSAHGIRGVQFIQRHGGIQAQSTVEHLHIKCVPFDAPDLSAWNYRKLKYTPLENVALLKQHAQKIVDYDLSFEKKYAQVYRLPVHCDGIIHNEKGDVLFQERTPERKFIPDIFTMPGGAIIDYSIPFEQELVREVKEETGLTLSPQGFKLVASRVTQITRTREQLHLSKKYSIPDQFILNTYRYVHPITAGEIQSMLPGDDCEKIRWIPQDDISSHPKISRETRDAIQLALQ